MKQNYSKRVKYDHRTLKGLLAERGETLRSASEKIGYARDYLLRCRAEGMISLLAVERIYSMFGIPYAEYEKPKKPSMELTDSEKRIYNMISSAVYWGVKKAINELK